MGSIYKALSRAGYLKPVVDNLNELIQRKRYEQELQQVAQLLSEKQRNIEGFYNDKKTVLGDANFQDTPVDEYGAKSVPDNTPLKELAGGIDLTDRGTALDSGKQEFTWSPEVLKNERGEFTGVMNKMIPRPGALKTLAGGQGEGQNIDRGTEQGTLTPYQEKTVSKYTPEEANKLAQQEIFDVAKELITNQNIDPNKGQQVLSALQQLITSQQPQKKNLKGIKTTDNVYDEYGRLVKEGIPKETTKKPTYPWKTIGTGDVDGREVVTQENIETGEKRQVDVGKTKEIKTTTNVYMPGETGLTPETSKLIADIKNFDPYLKKKDGDYVLDKDGKPKKMNDEDIKYTKDNVFENIKLQIFKKSPRAYQWVNHINKEWKDKGGSEYISPEDLNDEAIKHAKSGNLNDSDASEIASFIKYYEEIYPGLQK